MIRPSLFLAIEESMNKAIRAIFRTCPCGGTVRAVVMYAVNPKGVRTSSKREIGHGCNTCYDHKLVDIRDVFPDQAPQGALFRV